MQGAPPLLGSSNRGTSPTVLAKLREERLCGWENSRNCPLDIQAPKIFGPRAGLTLTFIWIIAVIENPEASRNSGISNYRKETLIFSFFLYLLESVAKSRGLRIKKKSRKKSPREFEQDPSAPRARSVCNHCTPACPTVISRCPRNKGFCRWDWNAMGQTTLYWLPDGTL